MPESKRKKAKRAVKKKPASLWPNPPARPIGQWTKTHAREEYRFYTTTLPGGLVVHRHLDESDRWFGSAHDLGIARIRLDALDVEPAKIEFTFRVKKYLLQILRELDECPATSA